VGLTIHYNLKSKHEDAKLAEQAVYQMRQLALNLPFEEVGEIVKGPFPKRGDSRR